MKRTKIAPTLRSFVNDWLDVDGEDTSKPNRYYREIVADLDALLALARAVGREGKPFADDEGPACICGPCRAYARLARLSRGERGGKA